MKPKHLLSDYLNGRISGQELRAWLAKDTSREARKTLEILNMNDAYRDALVDFAPPLEAPEHLAEKIGAVESWIEPQKQTEESAPSRGRLSKLVPALAVVGHSKPDEPQKKRKKPATRKKARQRKNNSSRRRTKK
jgi:hypothetical protein